MARWLVFEYDDFNPGGGMNDVKLQTNTFDEVLNSMLNATSNSRNGLRRIGGGMNILDNRTENYINFDIDDSIEHISKQLCSVSNMSHDELLDRINQKIGGMQNV